MNPEDAIKVLAADYVPSIYKRIARALAEGAATKTDMVRICKAHPASIHVAVKRMRKHKLLYITRWERNTRGQMLAYYSLGSNQDAVRPPKYTQAERCARWKEKHGKAKKTQMPFVPKSMTMAGLLGC